PVSTNNGEAAFDAATYHGVDPFAPQSTHTITYTFTDINGCDQSVAKNFLVNPSPQFLEVVGSEEQIQAASRCASEDVELFVEMADGVENYTFIWLINGDTLDGVDLIDGDGNVNDERIIFDFEGQFSVNFQVLAEYTGSAFTTRCQASSRQESITLGQVPEPNIVWVGTTAGSPLGTDFVITQDNASLPSEEITYFELFINGVSQFQNTTSELPFEYNYNSSSPGYSFDTPGTYPVSVVMRTDAGCDIPSPTRNIEIITHESDLSPSISYIEDFEDGVSGWSFETRSLDGKTDDLPTSWEWGTNVPDSPGGETSDGAAIYTTNAADPESGYLSSEVSFVYSPSFDLSAFDAPTISFRRFEDFETSRDGVVFQISTDDGRSWENVGAFDASLEPQGLASTPGWYNTIGIQSSPGSTSPPGEIEDVDIRSVAVNDQNIGWASNSDWQTAISPIVVPPGEGEFVRFRFALSAQADTKSTEGFAFDFVEIYERDQVVLIEQFS
ncbi:MAG: hypothetical protein AAFY41_12105, partial [Bacteroidota bacterium]